MPKKTYASVSCTYIHSIVKAGGVPLLLPMVCEQKALDGYLNIIDGLMLTGGDEGISPYLYGENPVKELEFICPERDEVESFLFRDALRRGMPVLGICRGMQLMNVAAGGSLYQDIFTQVSNSLGHLPKQMPTDALYHRVRFTEGSVLQDIFGTTELMVNSFHHQAVRRIADVFTPTAVSDDNIVEGIEHKEYDFAIGVQWHPEDLTAKYPHFLKLFEAFVKAAG